MTWFKVDDQLPDHRKFRTLGKDRLAATGLWVTTGAWCGANLTDGFVPDEIVQRFDPKLRLARLLVDVGLWSREDAGGESGYRFHDWDDHQPSRVDVEKRRREDARRQQESRGRRRAEASSRNGDGTYSRNGHGVSHGVTPGVTHAVSHPVDNSPVTNVERETGQKSGHETVTTVDARTSDDCHPHGVNAQVSGGCHGVSHPAPGPARPDPTISTSTAAPVGASPERAQNSGGGSATTLVGAWTEDHPGITATRRRELTDAVDHLLAGGADPALVPAALDEAHGTRWRNPVRALPHAYEDIRRGHNPTTSAPTATTDRRVAEAQALKARLRDQPDLRALPGGA